MKRVFAMIMLAAGLLSCVKENLIPAEEHDESAGIPVSFNIGVAETKAAKTGWAEGDVIYVFFNGIGKKYLKLERSDGRWTSKVAGGIFEREDFSSLSEKKLTAVHFPVGVKVEYEIGLQQFSFSKGGAPLYNYYLYEGGKSYAFDVTQEGVTVSATLSLRKPAGMVQIHVAGIQENVADYTFGCSLIRPEALTGVSKSSGGLVKKELQAGARLSGIADSDGAIFAGRLESPGVAANYKFTLASDTHLYTLTRPDRKLEAGKMYNFPAPSVTGGNNWTATAATAPMSFNISVSETQAEPAWAEGAVIYVFFKGLESKYLKLTRSGTGWSETAGGGDFELADFSPLSEQMLTAVHFPVAMDVSYSGGKFSFTSGGAPLYNYYLYDGGKAYTFDVTSEGATVSATLSLQKPAGMVQLHVAGIQENVADYTFGCSLIRPVACTGVKLDGSLTEDVLQAGARLSGIADSDGAIFAGRLEKPGVAADYKFTVASDTHLYTLTRPGRTLTAGKMYNFPAPSVTGGNNWTATAASELYVDLGLSVKWAKCNLGAATETEAGDYFAWGELQPKDDFSWGTYLWGNGSSFSKYTGSDYTVLQKEDDAAYAALGGKWRMPTEAEILEFSDLIGFYAFNDSQGANGSGHSYGQTTHFAVKSYITKTRITLPLSGRKIGVTVTNGGYYAYFWSSSLRRDNTAKAYTIEASPPYEAIDTSGDRYYGQPVRPVWSE